MSLWDWISKKMDEDMPRDPFTELVKKQQQEQDEWWERTRKEQDEWLKKCEQKAEEEHRQWERKVAPTNNGLEASV